MIGDEDKQNRWSQEPDGDFEPIPDAAESLR